MPGTIFEFGLSVAFHLPGAAFADGTVPALVGGVVDGGATVVAAGVFSGVAAGAEPEGMGVVADCGVRAGDEEVVEGVDGAAGSA
ncbi:hypothetical protein [Nocardia tengchongensis]